MSARNVERATGTEAQSTGAGSADATRRRRFRRATALVSTLAVAAVAPFLYPARASAQISVGNRFEFAAAVSRLRSTGGTIVLRPHWYRELGIPARGPRPLRIVAEPGASAGRLVLAYTQAVEISNLTVRPRGGHASLSVLGSRNIGFQHLSLAGGARLRANGSVIASSNVRFLASSFSRCGEGRAPVAGYCLRLRGTNGVTIESSRFADCFGCDFLHGAWNAHLRVMRTSFDRARVGRCGRDFYRCHHQDLIHLVEGRDFRFEANRFGLNEYGAAQIYLTGGIRGVTIRNNLFRGRDPLVPGSSAKTAMWIGNRRARDVPRRVVIVHNTILTGRGRTLRRDRFRSVNSILFSPLYSRLPRSERPLLANNVIRLMRTRFYGCARVGMAIRNVILTGRPCSESDTTGEAALDPEGRPTAASTLVIDRAAGTYSTPYDIEGVPRDPRPDIGAYEYVP